MTTGSIASGARTAQGLSIICTAGTFATTIITDHIGEATEMMEQDMTMTLTPYQFYGQLAVDILAVDGHAEMSDAAVAEAINARTFASTRTIPSDELLVWAALRGKLSGIQAAAVSAEHPAHEAAVVIVAMTTRAGDSFDPYNSDHVALLGELVAGGLLTTGYGDTDMADLELRYTISRPYVPGIYGVPAITEHDIAYVRSL